ncbi:imidazole glycerol phosphate synthase subunit HisH [Pontibacter anaerobius]|uniref:Imidazole glycerol phosphate synthase subunit HisH n=1 Tax=Pontibacter anaerobius TaxID=2993940 RepID=A0ABT3RIB3_9BACT|nr:imidazole glycerol phosphate synthase subunit HisH [Pontibacter anaerobius]MCX2741554.1 imidazole glycerol phosphate synthase subunit HisH [Pontibacter anaerobius]
MESPNICIIDYGLGNSGSIQNMLKRIGYKSTITNNTADLNAADLLFLPGVGSFDDGMSNLENLNLIPVLERKVLVEKTPIVGICLGMQLLLNSSEEGTKPGLGWIPGQCKKFDFKDKQERLRVPHMGWNLIHATQSDESILHLDIPELRYYFVHSYYAELQDQSHELCSTSYGFDFSSGIRKENILGLQFHPEKSHKFGMLLFKNIVNQLTCVKS